MGDRYRIQVHPSYVGLQWYTRFSSLFGYSGPCGVVGPYTGLPQAGPRGSNLQLFGKSGIEVSEYGILTVSAGSEAGRGGHQVPGGGVQTAARL